MDFALLSMNLAQSQLMTNVSTAVLAKSMDMAEATGESITQLIDSATMEHSVHPELGSNIDIFI